MYNEDRKKEIQDNAISMFKRSLHLPFSNQFRNDKIFSEIIEYLKDEDYCKFLNDAFSEEGFYNKSYEYIEKFGESDRELLRDFIEVCQDVIEVENIQ